MLPKAKKSFSQNWLVDESVLRKIVQGAEIQPGDRVLEIGPGTGVLTQALVNAGAEVTAIEADKTLMAGLQDRFGHQITLHFGDALSSPEKYPETPYKLVANIPYNITSELVQTFLTTKKRPTSMILMVQREVADRIISKPPQMSLFSVVCQTYAQCKKLFNVPAGAFRPVPKVDSAVVKLDLLPIHEQESIIQLAKQGFSSKRKQLHKNLSSMVDVSSEQVKTWLTELDFDPRIRAEALSVDDWKRLTHKYKEFIIKKPR
jgi:16S rRNA (adenine1518-N6/adenine1519-N6)-dimethyltransferase